MAKDETGLERKQMTRRSFLDRSGKLAVAGIAAAAGADALADARTVQRGGAPLPAPAQPANGGKRPQRVALIGADHYHATSTPNYLQILQRENLDIVGIHAPEPGYADKWATEYKTAAFTDYRQMVEKTKPEFVVALGHHAAMPAEFRFLVSAGIPFLMEKPWGTDDKTINELADLAESKKAWVALPMPFRYGWFAQTAVKLREAGQLGTISHGLFRFNQPGIQRYYDLGSGWMLDKKEAGGGALINLGIHGFDLWRFISGEEPKVVAASTSHSMFHKDVEDYAFATMHTPSGAILFNEAGYTFPTPKTPGRYGSDQAQLLSASQAFLRGGGGTGGETIEVITDAGSSQEKPPEGYLSGWPRVVHECLDRLARKEPPPATARDMARAATLAWDAYRLAHEPTVGRS